MKRTHADLLRSGQSPLVRRPDAPSSSTTPATQPLGGSYDPGSRLAFCPSCGKSFHKLLLNDHLDKCLQSWAADASAPPPAPSQATQATQAAPASQAGPSVDDGAAIVPCPICGIELRNDAMDAHVEACLRNQDAGGPSHDAGGPSQEDAGAPSQVPSQATTQGDDPEELVCCPACNLQMPLSELNPHLDRECAPAPGAPEPAPAAEPAPAPAAEAPAAPEPPPEAPELPPVAPEPAPAAPAPAAPAAAAPAPAAPAAAAVAAYELMAQSVRCSVCHDTFDDPHSLPCQHTFCKECIDGCFRAQKTDMKCPLCNQPVWRRQVTPNVVIADIVASVRALPGAPAPEPPEPEPEPEPPPDDPGRTDDESDADSVPRGLTPPRSPCY